MADANVIATITDASGYTTTCITHIHADDVRCFTGNGGIAKVTICHKTGSAKNPCIKMCVDQDAVNEHLAHGDFLGKCTPDCNPSAASNSSVSGNYGENDMLKVKVLPNPGTTEFNLIINSNSNEQVEIVVFDLYGKKVYQGRGSINEKYRFGNKFVSGIYILQVIQGAKIQTIKLIKG